MKKLLKTLAILLGLFAGGTFVAYAAGITTNQGGTGVSNIAPGAIPYGEIFNIRIGTSTGLTFASSTQKLSFTYGSSTAISAPTFCIGTDCRTGWPSAGGGTFPFTVFTSYNGTTTPIGFSGGAFTNGSTTISSVGSGLVGAQNGLLYGFASSSLFGYTPLNPTRTINTTAPLAGGGDLSADRTFSINANGITYSLFQQVAANSLVGNNTSATANAVAIATSSLFGTCAGGQVVGWSNVSGGLGCIATSTVAGGVTSIATNNGITGGTITTTGTIGLATINAGVLGAQTNGSVPTSQATSTLFGTGTGGQILTWNNGVPQWVASTTYSNGTGISTAFSNGALTITNTGVTSLGNGTGTTCSGTAPGSCSLASMAAGVLGTAVTGIPTSQATSTLYGTGTGGLVLGWSNATNGLAFIATSTSFANLTATDSTLTFSGTYNGSTARTIGINLGNANTWSALQQFTGNASTTQLSVWNNAYFGATATTTISSNGSVAIPVGATLRIATTTGDTARGVGISIATSTAIGGAQATSYWYTIPYAANVTVNMNNGNAQRIFLAGNSVLDLTSTSSSPLDGTSLLLKACQDAVGSRTLTFGNPVSLRWATLGASPGATTTISSAAKSCSLIGFSYDASSTIWSAMGSTTGISNY